MCVVVFAKKDDKIQNLYFNTFVKRITCCHHIGHKVGTVKSEHESVEPTELCQHFPQGWPSLTLVATVKSASGFCPQ